MPTLVCPTLNEAFLARVQAVSLRVLGVSHLTGHRLTRAVQQVSRERSEVDTLAGDDEALGALLQFFLPRDLLKVHGPLAELASLGALPSRRSWRLLDLGAGLGTTSLGVARFAALHGAAERLEISAYDCDPEALELFEELSRDLSSLPGVPIELVARTADVADPGFIGSLDPSYDLICIGSALNELSASAEPLLRQLSRLLSADGAIVVIEPAQRESSRSLQRLRDALVARAQPPYVFAPCLTRAACPLLQRERDFCHQRLPCVLPAGLAAVAASAGLRDRDLSYSYLTLRNDARSLRELEPGRELFRVVSGQLASKGKTELWLCGEKSFSRALRLDRHRSDTNAGFAEADRGSILSIADAEPRPDSLRITPATRIETLQAWQLDDNRER